MAEREEPMTSEVLARAMDTNPVVIRRMMAGLRDRGYVRSEKGHGGGWVLGKGLAEITLRDVYDALGSPPLFAIGHRSEHPGCPVEKAVNAALGKTLEDAEAVLRARLGEVTLAAVQKDRLKRPRGAKHEEHDHGA